MIFSDPWPREKLLKYLEFQKNLGNWVTETHLKSIKNLPKSIKMSMIFSNLNFVYNLQNL